MTGRILSIITLTIALLGAVVAYTTLPASNASTNATVSEKN